MTRKLPPLPWRIHADKRTSAAYLVYDKNNDFLSDYTSDEVAAYLEKAVNSYEADQEKIKKLVEALQNLADAADLVGIHHFDTDSMDADVEDMQNATESARAILAECKGE